MFFLFFYSQTGGLWEAQQSHRFALNLMEKNIQFNF